MTDLAKATLRRRLWIAGGVLGSAAAVAVIVWITAPEPSFELWGSVQLDSRGAFSMAPECGGKDGYDDINPGAAVTVYDDTGKVVGAGNLGKGKYASAGGRGPCIFTFSVADVPGGAAFYQVEVSHRGKVTVSRDDAKSLVTLSLG